MSIPITPETKVAELLDAYPQLEAELIAAASVFRKLKNPVLRRTIARVTSLARAAEVGGIPARELVNRLRRAAGLEALDPSVEAEAGEAMDESLDWADPAQVRWTVDADELLERGQHPIGEVQRRVAGLGPGDLGLIRSSFRPAPLIEALKTKGYRTGVVRSGDRFATFVGPAAG